MRWFTSASRNRAEFSLTSLISFVVSVSLFGSAVAQTDNLDLEGNGAATYGSPVATTTLCSQHNFASSWNQPFTGAYNPPGVTFNRVSFEIQVNTTGLNYDRLALIMINGVEIWRTSTSEPGRDDSYWSYTKDLTQYLPLLSSAGQVQILLNNVIEGKLNGDFTVTLLAHYYQSSTDPSDDDYWALTSTGPPSWVQSIKNPNGFYWSDPDMQIQGSFGPLDRTVNRAVLHIFASGNSNEEFWWGNTVSDTDKSGPSRFVDVYVNGQLAGFATPFPILFTGGITPYLWKPLTGLRTYDVPAYYVDLSPFLPTLWDSTTQISLNVSNGIDGSQVQGDWLVNANLMVWKGNTVNSGSQNPPQVSNQNSGPNKVGLPQQISVNRQVSTSARINFGGSSKDVTWTQNHRYSNNQWNDAVGNNVYQWSSGQDTATGLYSISRSFQFPLTANMGNNYVRVQQTFRGYGANYVESWMDTSVNLDSNGNMQSSSSKQYLSESGQVRNAAAVNGKLLYS